MPPVPPLTSRWGSGQPLTKVHEIRDQIRQRVELLLAELAVGPRSYGQTSLLTA